MSKRSFCKIILGSRHAHPVMLQNLTSKQPYNASCRSNSPAKHADTGRCWDCTSLHQNLSIAHAPSWIQMLVRVCCNSAQRTHLPAALAKHLALWYRNFSPHRTPPHPSFNPNHASAHAGQVSQGSPATDELLVAMPSLPRQDVQICIGESLPAPSDGPLLRALRYPNGIWSILKASGRVLVRPDLC